MQLVDSRHDAAMTSPHHYAPAAAAAAAAVDTHGACSDATACCVVQCVA